MNNKKILISGGGIAGLTLSFWLKKYGFEPVVIEVAPSVRGGGYMIDFWGVGYTVAERMGIVNSLAQEQEKYKINELQFVNEQNQRVGGLKTARLRKLANGRYLNILRSALEKVLYEAVKDKVEIRFSTSVKEIQQGSGGVMATFNNGTTESFDLLIGADGLRSNIRKLVFGPDEKFERFLQYYTAAYTIENFAGKDKLFLSYNIPNKQVGIYDAGNNQLSTFYIFSSKEYYGHLAIAEKKQKLSKAFKHLGWYTPQLMKRMDSTSDFYFDAVSQIEMPVWHQNRIALAGDACQAVSLVSGQGSSLAMAGAYVLAGELKKYQGDYTKAFPSYQHIMKPEIERKQKSARDFAGSFVPSSQSGIFFRNLFTNLLSVPFVSDYLVNKFISDKIRLEEYEKSVL